MIKDTALKDRLLRHFWAQRIIAQPEILVHYAEGVSSPAKQITDVDILALRPHRDLYYEKVLGDCRTLKGQSPASRVLWLRGLLSFVKGHAGFVLLANTTRIEQDHKLAATELGIVLLSEEDFRVYDSAIVYPDGSDHVGISVQDLRDFAFLYDRYAGLKPLLKYAYGQFWLEETFGQRIRHTLGQIRGVARELSPDSRMHRAVLCDTAALLAVGVAECAGKIFHEYLHPGNKDSLSEALKVLVWGGPEEYRFYRAVREKLVEAKGKTAAVESPLELPYWDIFVQLVRNVLERPRAAFQVPWLLRHLAIDIKNARAPLGGVTADDLLLLKFAMLTLSYVCKASNAPREFEELMLEPLVHRQSDLAAGAQTTPNLSTSRAARAAPLGTLNSDSETRPFPFDDPHLVPSKTSNGATPGALSILSEGGIMITCANPVYLTSSPHFEAGATITFEVLDADASHLKKLLGRMEIFGLDPRRPPIRATLTSLEHCGGTAPALSLLREAIVLCGVLTVVGPASREDLRRASNRTDSQS